MLLCALVVTPDDFVQVGGHGGHPAGDLDHEQVAGDSAPLVDALERRGSHVVPDPHRLDPDALVGGHFGGHVEVQDVAGVVAVEIEHPFALVQGLGERQDDVGRWRGEDVAAGSAVPQVFADEPVEERLVAAAAADQQADLALGQRGLDQGVDALQLLDLPVIGLDQPFQELRHDILGIVDDLLGLLHDCPPRPWIYGECLRGCARRAHRVAIGWPCA